MKALPPESESRAPAACGGGDPACAHHDPHTRVSSLLSALEESQVYRDYKQVFVRTTGLPLRLKVPHGEAKTVTSKSSPFCVVMARNQESCASCLAVQRKLEEEAQAHAKTVTCFAGLCETAVPIRVGEEVVAFLETGQVILGHPDGTQFSKAAERLLDWGASIDLRKAEEAYFSTRVLSRSQYESMVRLLTIFAGHLSECAQQLVMAARGLEPPAVAQARKWIEANSVEEIHLASVAGAVNMSAKYFSEVFHQATGIPFVEYVARVRVEKAKHLLRNPNLRIGEIAFEVGFQSLSQFNRSFLKYAGKSPRAFRHDGTTP